MDFEEYGDDPTISDEAELWRRIPPWHVVSDQNSGQRRASSAAFDNDPDGSPMSVVLAAESGGPAAALAGHPEYALATITAGLARSL